MKKKETKDSDCPVFYDVSNWSGGCPYCGLMVNNGKEHLKYCEKVFSNQV